MEWDGMEWHAYIPLNFSPKNSICLMTAMTDLLLLFSCLCATRDGSSAERLSLLALINPLMTWLSSPASNTFSTDKN
jgi:hypothetical protein